MNVLPSTSVIVALRAVGGENGQVDLERLRNGAFAAREELPRAGAGNLGADLDRPRHSHGEERSEASREYASQRWIRADLDPDPHAQFDRWFAEAATAGCTYPSRWPWLPRRRTGCPRSGWCSSRVTTRAGSSSTRTARAARPTELDAEPRAAAALYWEPQNRQVRVEGPVEQVARRRVRRVLPHPAARAARSAPGRRRSLDVVREPAGARTARRRDRAAVRGRRRHPPAAVLGRLPDRRLRRSSSGRASRTGSTTACATSWPAASGAASASARRTRLAAVSAYELELAGASACFRVDARTAFQSRYPFAPCRRAAAIWASTCCVA